jgi:uncharacterized membrane protein YdjX (TVP38/TMEM64 family)
VEGFRYANIGIAVGTVIIAGGVLAFKDSSEAAMQVVAMVGLFTALAVALTLTDRARRRKDKRTQ